MTLRLGSDIHIEPPCSITKSPTNFCAQVRYFVKVRPVSSGRNGRPHHFYRKTLWFRHVFALRGLWPPGAPRCLPDAPDASPNDLPDAPQVSSRCPTDAPDTSRFLPDGQSPHLNRNFSPRRWTDISVHADGPTFRSTPMGRNFGPHQWTEILARRNVSRNERRNVRPN